MQENLRIGQVGYRHTAETKAKISDSLIGNQNSLGKKPSAETKAKISAAKRGKPRSAETKAKISASMLSRRRMK